MRPRSTAHGKNRDIGASGAGREWWHGLWPTGVCARCQARHGIVQKQSSRFVPATPRHPALYPHAKCVKSCKPRSHQRRCTHHLREDPAACAHKGWLAKRGTPLTQVVNPKCFKSRDDASLGSAVTRHKGVARLRVGEVEAAMTCEHKLASGRRHTFKNSDRDASLCKDLGGHESRGTAAYNMRCAGRGRLMHGSSQPHVGGMHVRRRLWS